MRTFIRLAPVALFSTVSFFQACANPPLDNTGEFAVAGVIKGTLTYSGVHPCSRSGHIVGNAIILVFDRRNPPPPGGLANTAVNFAVVEGDVLFANEPRNPGKTTYCPAANGATETITATAPYIISPMAAGSYIIQSFYDADGTFFPTFKIQNLPKEGDVAGGYVDLAAAMSASAIAQGVNYVPTYLPVDIGTPLPLDPALPANSIPQFVLPSNGFVRDNIAVDIGEALPLTRPYFYPSNVGHPDPTVVMDPGTPTVDPANPADFADTSDAPATAKHPGSTEGDANYAPIVTMTQDWLVDAVPTSREISQQTVDQQQTTFASVRLNAGFPQAEIPDAVAVPDYTKPPPYPPFQFQIPATPSLLVWPSGNTIPESPLVPQMYPLVVFAKLVDDPTHTVDPQGVTPQGSLIAPNIQPIVIIQGITLFHDNLFQTAGAVSGTTLPSGPADPLAAADHVTVLVRPSVICFNPAAIDRGGILVTPHELGPDPANPTGPSNQEILSPMPSDVIANANAPATPSGRTLIQGIKFACLPEGRYEMNAVYPTVQGWTTPNEAGSCASEEGSTVFNVNPAIATCTKEPRPVLYSQGNRGVLEIVPASDATFCGGSNSDGTSRAVPVECLPCKSGEPWGAFGTCPTQ